MRLGDNLYKAGSYNYHHTEASMLRWRQLHLGFMRLNVDGACGGVIGDHTGKFQGAFACNLKSCSITQLELWAILHGINMARERGFMALEVHSDSEEAIQRVQGLQVSHNLDKNIVDSIKTRIAARDWKMMHTNKFKIHE